MIKVEDYYEPGELSELGIGSFGRHVYISRKAVICYPGSLQIGNFVRLDAYCNIIGSAKLELGDHVHIGSAVSISASAPIMIGSYSGIASGARLFTSDDDYSGVFLTGPTVSSETSSVNVAPIELQAHNVIGANSVVLPGTVLKEGAVIGALSLAKGHYGGWAIYGGVPARKLKERSRELLARISQSEP